MPTLREHFCDIANCHNNVTMTTSCIEEMLKMNPLTKQSAKELKLWQEKLISMLQKAGNSALDADKKVKELKDYIYKTTSPDAALS